MRRRTEKFLLFFKTRLYYAVFCGVDFANFFSKKKKMMVRRRSESFETTFGLQNGHGHKIPIQYKSGQKHNCDRIQVGVLLYKQKGTDPSY